MTTVLMLRYFFLAFCHPSGVKNVRGVVLCHGDYFFLYIFIFLLYAKGPVLEEVGIEVFTIHVSYERQGQYLAHGYGCLSLAIHITVMFWYFIKFLEQDNCYRNIISCKLNSLPNY